ncbi:MAG TPA: flagellar FlbD family protein [Kineosporiaceae bacterium]|nr:flagellar FlbD family protein [Kineosporiaceae bacterium]
MIILTRLGGAQVAVNPDLIERAEPTPDTVITMVDGHKLLVAESVEEVVEAVRAWRASVAAAAYGISHRAGPSTPGAGPDGGEGGWGRAAELAADDVTAHSALGSSLARVLRMPPREG